MLLRSKELAFENFKFYLQESEFQILESKFLFSRISNLPNRNLRLRRLPLLWTASPQSRTNMTRYAFSPSMAAACEKVSKVEETAATRKQEETNAWRIGTHHIERGGHLGMAKCEDRKVNLLPLKAIWFGL